ncbi:hypothetical protein D3C78_1076510 [compost metagenome]
MVLVQFGRQVIHQINTLTASSLADQVPLGNPQCANHQLLLATGQDVRGVVCAQSETQISTLWSGLGMPHLLVPLQRPGEHSTQFTVLVPAAVIAERQAFKLNQFAQGLFKDWFQGFDISAAVFIDFSAGLAQFPVPNRLRNGVKCTMPQPRVSLAQGLLQALPG